LCPRDACFATSCPMTTLAPASNISNAPSAVVHPSVRRRVCTHAEFIDISRVGEDTGSLVVSAKSLTFGLPTRGVTAGLQSVPTGSSHLDHVR
jgi:hypothetical protein